MHKSTEKHAKLPNLSEESKGKHLFQMKCTDFIEICEFPVKSTFICRTPTGKHLSKTKDRLPRKVTPYIFFFYEEEPPSNDAQKKINKLGFIGSCNVPLLSNEFRDLLLFVNKRKSNAITNSEPLDNTYSLANSIDFSWNQILSWKSNSARIYRKQQCTCCFCIDRTIESWFNVLILYLFTRINA